MAARVVVATALIVGAGTSGAVGAWADAAHAETAAADTAGTTDPAVVSDDAGTTSSVPAGMMPADTGVTIAPGGNDAAADVLGRGYEQTLRFEGSRIEIREPTSRGGGVLHTFDVGASDHWPASKGIIIPIPSPIFFGSEYWYHDPIFRSMRSTFTLHSHDHGASRLAALGDSFYISNVRTTESLGNLAVNGSVVRKYTRTSAPGAEPRFELTGERYFSGQQAVTALDAFRFQDTDYLAIGLNTGGVRVANAERREDGSLTDLPDFRIVHEDWNGRAGALARDMVTAVALGTNENGSFLLTAGKFTNEHPAIVTSDLNGESTGERNVTFLWSNNWRAVGPAWEWPDVIEFGRFGPNKKTMVAIGWTSLRRVSFLDSATGTDWTWYDSSSPVHAIKFFTDAKGEQRVALRYDDGTGLIGRVAANGKFEISDAMTHADLPLAIPGYRPWALTLENRATGKVDIETFRGASRWNGCWWAGEVTQAGNPLPSTPVTVSQGTTAGPYFTAQRTRGDDCGGNPGTFYVQVQPAGAPQQVQLVKLIADRDTVRVDRQVGRGRYHVAVELDGTYGVKLVVTEPHGAPTPEGKPTLSAERLTPEPVAGVAPTDDPDDLHRPVYRFTVDEQHWQVPGADQLDQVKVPVPTVEASSDQALWTPLGTTTPLGTPSREGTRVTLGQSSFYWQTPPGKSDYRYFRLTLPDGTVSETVDVTLSPAPTDTTLVTALASSGSGVIRPNGLDQASVRLSLMTGNGVTERALDPAQHPDLYDRVYYRDGQDALITGLGNATSRRSFATISQGAGQADSASVAGALPVQITGTSAGALMNNRAVIRASAGKPVAKKPLPNVGVSEGSLVADGNSTAGSALIIGGCPEGACRLVEPTPTRPLFYGADQATISLQLQSRALPGVASLPLNAPNVQPETIPLAEDGFSYSGSSVALRNANLFSFNSTISTYLVTHGELVPALNIYVKQKE